MKDVMNHLIQHSVIVAYAESQNDSDERYRVKLNPEHIDWEACVRIHNPVRILHCRSLDINKSTSKLDVVLQLLHHEWKPIHDSPYHMYVQGDSKEFPIAMVLKSVLGLKSLLNASDIFGRGAPHILFNHCEAYYKCLFNLQDLHALHARSDFNSLTNSDFEKLCKGIPVVPAVLALEDGEVLPDIMDGAVPVAEGITVYFDGCSHSNGKQRLFINSPNVDAHGRCSLYQLLEKHESERACAAYLLAWRAESHLHDTRHEHYASVPSNGAQAAWMAKLN